MTRPVANRLLAALSESDAAVLWPHLNEIELPVRYVLFEANTTIQNVYFLEQGFASVVAKTPSGGLARSGYHRS